MEKLFYSIGETAALLGITVSKVRFWTNSFPRQLKPQRTAKGNRLYTREDIDVLKQIAFLSNEKGLTLEGVAKELSGGQSSADKTVKAVDTLREIRSQLVEIRKTL